MGKIDDGQVRLILKSDFSEEGREIKSPKNLVNKITVLSLLTHGKNRKQLDSKLIVEIRTTNVSVNNLNRPQPNV